MKLNIYTLSYIFAVFFLFLFACNQVYNPTHKDLDENMIDLKAYQENLGDEIKAGRLEDAVWLFEGMDSILKVVSVTFPEHRKLKKPFSEYYKIKMKKPIDEIREAIEKKDQPTALEGYRILVRRCNSCHEDLDINKEVKY